MYCPCCKKYDETDFDPVKNIKKFMDYIKKEQDKLKKYRRKQARKSHVHSPARSRSPAKKVRHTEMQNDSMSDITDIEKEEILTKYYKENMTKTEKKAEERKHV